MRSGPLHVMQRSCIVLHLNVIIFSEMSYVLYVAQSCIDLAVQLDGELFHMCRLQAFDSNVTECKTLLLCMLDSMNVVRFDVINLSKDSSTTLFSRTK